MWDFGGLDVAHRSCLGHHIVREKVPEAHRYFEKFVFGHIAQLH